MATAIPDRGDHPRRRVKYSDMIVNKVHPSGAYEISHIEGNQRHNQVYYGYNKKSAMKKFKDDYQSGNM